MSTLKVTNIQHGSATNVAMVLDTAGTVKAYSTISVGNATPSSSGAGITFPATASASSDANTLDDYEEGTWTPSDGSGAGLSFTVSGTSTYVKVGRICIVCAYVTYPSTASGSIAKIGGLPFTVASTTENMQGGLPSQTDYTTTSVYLQILTNSTSMALLSGNTLLTNANFSTKTIRFSAIYITT